MKIKYFVATGSVVIITLFAACGNDKQKRTSIVSTEVDATALNEGAKEAVSHNPSSGKCKWTKKSDQDGTYIAMRVDNPNQGILEIAYSKKFGLRFSAYDHNERRILIETPVLVEFYIGEQMGVIEPEKVENCMFYTNNQNVVKNFSDFLNNGSITSIGFALGVNDEWIRYEWPMNTNEGDFNKAKELL